MELNSLLDGTDLRAVHTVASLIGCGLAVYVMQLWGTGEIGGEEHWIFVHARRISLGLVALAFLWSLSYSDEKGWQPWAPDLGAIIAIDLLLLSTVISSRLRKRKDVPLPQT